MREVTFPGNSILDNPRQVLKIYIQITLYVLNRLYLGIYMFIKLYIHVVTISEKRGHELGGEQRGIAGKVQREEKEGKML